MSIHVDFGVSENCINIWSYGVICVHCGCCENEPDLEKRLNNQLEYYSEMLEEEKNFSMWSDIERIRSVQEKNVKDNIEYFKKKIAEIQEQLKEQK